MIESDEPVIEFSLQQGYTSHRMQKALPFCIPNLATKCTQNPRNTISVLKLSKISHSKFPWLFICNFLLQSHLISSDRQGFAN